MGITRVTAEAPETVMVKEEPAPEVEPKTEQRQTAKAEEEEKATVGSSGSANGTVNGTANSTANGAANGMANAIPPAERQEKNQKPPAQNSRDFWKQVVSPRGRSRSP